jgi:hypothetical protein
MKRTLKKYATNEYGQRTSCNIDVRPLNQRETKMNTRKGMLKAETEKKPINAVVQLPLFGNPFEPLPVIDNNELPDLDTDLASLLPDYARKYQKYGLQKPK